MLNRLFLLAALTLFSRVVNADNSPCRNGVLSPADRGRNCQCVTSWPERKPPIEKFALYAVCESHRTNSPGTGEFYFQGSLTVSAEIVAALQEVVGPQVVLRNPRMNREIRFSYSVWSALGLPKSFENGNECWRSEGVVEITGLVVIDFEKHGDGVFVDRLRLPKKLPIRKCQR